MDPNILKITTWPLEYTEPKIPLSHNTSQTIDVMTSWSTLSVACAICSALSQVRQAIFEPSWHITWLLIYRGPLAMKTVIWPSSADRFLSPSPLPSSSSLYFSFISLGWGPTGTWWEEWGKNGSSAQCKSLSPGKPVSDVGPHGPLTCCLLWFMVALGLWPVQIPLLSLSFISLQESAGLQGATHCTTVYGSIQNIPSTCCTSRTAGSETSTASYTVLMQKQTSP